MSTIPSHLRYSAEHEWVDESSPVKVGLSAVAVDALGDVVYLDLPEAGATVTAGEVCGEVESTKSVSELFAPVSGTVAEVNAAVVDEPGLVNSDPYGEGWLFTVEVTEEGELLTAEQYAQAQEEQA
ncbi:glycine cleavage system protein GcvH [Kocuria sp. CPCC 205292]|jgi:glycine cleavage system H protein|uniref:Glycine cleavage system H protein n=1 Tax=Kocuria rosea subsp. polaris TaxID=136273 RepID=A0A0W8IM11_KOCRO|nr:glycine cleavage system protein GcvH [Kocuria polaris]KUG61298.1 glycine cleavage system protein H [Kocuria polaris]